MMGDKKLVEVKHLKKYFSVGKNLKLKAIDDVSFSPLCVFKFGNDFKSATV